MVEDEYFRELVRIYRKLTRPRKKLGYMRRKAVIARLVPVEVHGAEGKGETEERK